MRPSKVCRVFTLTAAALAGCAGDTTPRAPARTPESIQADIQALIPSSVAQRAAWAVDLQLVFAALRLDPSRANVGDIADARDVVGRVPDLVEDLRFDGQVGWQR